MRRTASATPWAISVAFDDHGEIVPSRGTMYRLWLASAGALASGRASRIRLSRSMSGAVSGSGSTR